MVIPFSTSNAAGFGFSQVFTPPLPGSYNTGETVPVAYGTVAVGSDGSQWLYCLFGVGGVTGPGFVVVYDENFLAVMLNLTNDILGEHVGVAPATALAGDSGWVQVYGTCDNMQVLASCAANVNLNSTATSGALDDAGATGFVISGVILTTARAASQGNAPAILNWPLVTATAGP